MRRSEYVLYNKRTRNVVGMTLLTEVEAEFINRKCESAGSDIRVFRLPRSVESQLDGGDEQ